MNIYIDNRSGLPIYEQIVSQIKNQIISGTLADGEALPSMRQLARELNISVITTKRAYEDLEREGFLATVPGKGSYVSGADPERFKAEMQRKILASLSAAVEAAFVAGIDARTLKEMIDTLFKGDAP